MCSLTRRLPTPTKSAPCFPPTILTPPTAFTLTDSGTISKGDRTGQPWISMVVPLKLQLGSAVQALGLPAEFQLTDRAFLDLTPQGGMDNSKGKNNQQRKYRDAAGLNKPGEAFAWRMLTGRVVKVKVAHELYLENIVEKVAQVLPG